MELIDFDEISFLVAQVVVPSESSDFAFDFVGAPVEERVVD